MEKKKDSYTWATEKIRLVDSNGEPLLLHPFLNNTEVCANYCMKVPIARYVY